MAKPSETFDAGVDRWHDWQRSPWGRLRYSQAEANLGRHLDGTPLRILDLAGGNGPDAIRLARAGHHVTIVDYSADMLADAEAGFAREGLTDRLRVLQADVADLAAPAPGDRYDVVLCHNLIQYSDDPAATLAVAAAWLRPGGLLSVIAINRHSGPLRKATLDLDPAAALAELDTTESWTSTFNTTLRPYSAAQVVEWLAGLGHEVIGHYGIRAVSDYIADNDRKRDPAFFAQLERLEFALADRMPYPQIARFFHLVSRCRAGQLP